MTHLPTQPQYKVFVIGLDGATFDLMLPWIDDGLLPNLGRLIKNGAHSRLNSTIPPITPCAWSSFMTGKNPGKHGLFDFVEPSPNGKGFQFTNACARHGETVWGCLSRHGRRVGVINVPMTFPPEPVNGYLISGLDTPHEAAGYSFPAELRSELRKAGISYRVDLRHLGDMRTNRRRDRRLKDLHEMESIRTSAVRYLQRQYTTDFTMVVYIATDQVQHHFWHYMDRNHEKFDAVGARRYENVIRDTYVHLDGLIGKLLDDMDDNTIVIVMSDHGFGPTTDVRIRGNQALAAGGLLRFEPEAQGRKWVRRFASIVDRGLRSSLSPGVKAWLSGALPRIRTWFEDADEAKLDWNNTVAFFNEAYRASPSVWIRNEHRPVGCSEDTGQILKEIIQVLSKLEHPHSGERVISKLISTRDIYHGPYTDHAPDVLLSWWEDGFLLNQSDPHASAESTVELSTSPIVGGVEFSGSHRLDGVLIIHGGPAKTGFEFAGAGIIDVAPTILYLMGLPIPSDMDGRPLTEALETAWTRDRSPRFEADAPNGEDGPSSRQQSMDPKQERLIARRLQALGYIE